MSAEAANDAEVCDVRVLHQDAVTQTRRALPDDTLLANTAELLKLLSDPTRIRVLSALRVCELCVYDLAAVLGMSESTVSHQLRVLRAARLVRHRKEGRHVFYRLSDEHVFSILDAARDHTQE
ncbi:MAG TPA: metalloregulator ArsR/SmtB family transcription factor [Gammaproteobacteria bacterium]|nr:metalloregulator ArsR/SmtB family transcription factor [Gammaproteobacteria bacterium]